jgi:hypothetical protein
MDTEQFLHRVLGTGAHYCLFGSRGDGRKVQRFYTSIEELAENAAALDGRGADAYFGVARYASDESRKADNVESVGAFFLDLDCAPDKEFADKRDALRQLKAFCDDVELPRPMVVDSGGGLHVYWLLTEPAPRDQWVRVAELLKKTCANKNFPADPAVTADAARILRIPGTRNFKYEEPVSVRVLMGGGGEHSIEHIGGKLLGANDSDNAATNGLPFAVPVLPEGLTSNAAMEHLMGNRKASFRTILEKTKADKGCAQLAYIIRARAEASEPQWRAGLSIAVHCVDREKAITVVSKGHPGYDPEETKRKAESIRGPYLCETFDELNPGGCDGCPNAGKVKSPIVLGQYVEEADEDDEPVTPPTKASPPPPAAQFTHGGYTIPAFPKPYFRAKGGGVYVRSKDEDGEPEDKLVYRHDLYVIRRIRDPEFGESLVLRVHFPMDGVSEFTLPLTAATSKEELRKCLAKEGIAVPNWDAIMRYVMSWIDELQVTVAADEARRQFGWTDDNATSFVLGDREIFADRIEHNPPSINTQHLFPEFEPRGTLEGWKECMEFYNQPGMELHQLVQLMSFGSALMHSSPVNCAALHIWSGDSGFGKTTAFYSALSAWGRPKGLVMSKEDTLNAKMHRADVYHNLPLALDEVTNMNAKDLSTLAYQFTGGQQKDRMTSGANQTRHRGREWKLLAVTNANTSFLERVAGAKSMPKAEAQRILEVRVEQFFSTTADKLLTDEFSKKVHNHYGHAGALFVQYYLNNREAIDRLMVATQGSIDTAAGLTSQNRFWSELASKSMTAGLVLRKMGLVNWDMKRLSAFIVGVLQKNRGVAAELEAGCMEQVLEYTTENFGKILQIKSTDDLRVPAQGNGLDMLVRPDFEPRTQLYGRYETDTCTLFLLPAQLKSWCNDKQISYDSLRRELGKEYGAQTKKVRITKGTTLRLPPQNALAIKLPPELAEDFLPVEADAEGTDT